MITWRCWSKTLSALLATSKIVTFATRLNTSQGRINSFTGDGAYDTQDVHKACYLRGEPFQSSRRAKAAEAAQRGWRFAHRNEAVKAV